MSIVVCYGSAGAYYVNADNLAKSAVTFTVRRIITQTWINDRDQFLIPTIELPDEFYNDCLIWMLFNGSNLTASADGLEWNGKTWSIVNHFIPFTEDEVRSPDRFESDFMVRYLEGKTLSKEAKDVMDEGRKIWCEYFKHTYDYRTRDELKLNRCDVGWYQIRQALKRYNDGVSVVPVDFSGFESAYKRLSDKLRPCVYEYGFLK